MYNEHNSQEIQSQLRILARWYVEEPYTHAKEAIRLLLFDRMTWFRARHPEQTRWEVPLEGGETSIVMTDNNNLFFRVIRSMLVEEIEQLTPSLPVVCEPRLQVEEYKRSQNVVHATPPTPTTPREECSHD